jgi:hypothetical protein
MKRVILAFLIICGTTLMSFANEETVAETKSTFELFDSLLGGFIGGILGVIGTILSSYYGPRKLEKWRNKQKELKADGPRKKLLLQMLNDEEYKDGRSLTAMSRVIGADYEECRRLLIEIEARGLTIKDKQEKNIEGWALIKNKPLNEE